MSRDIRVLRQAASWCLRYPDDTTLTAFPTVRAALTEVKRGRRGDAPLGRAADGVVRFLDYAERLTPLELSAHYVTVFDLRNRRSLNLTWWSAGDTRRRGTALLEFHDAYRAAGWKFGGEDLPDHLPAVLEFAALDDRSARAAGDRLLAGHRDGLDALGKALTLAGTPYAGVVEAVTATLPKPSRAERRAERTTAGDPPLVELVGLDGYRAGATEAGGVSGAAAGARGVGLSVPLSVGKEKRR